MTTQIDLSGLKCPLPALKTRKALRDLAPGEQIRVICTDPLSAIDIPSLLSDTGDRLLETKKQGGRIVFVIEKRVANGA
ncbi:tRNA 2-thiouridine synthesizing protein A [Pseudaminobacter salicylatoxidans]|uniref:tRNA 2-thiouridine synthesizing protein A n=1 Tax=Pseudaminobacter salicylatoxidans TaxID=93369 RepID=A0A316BXW4_PSESE|nr:sulfurtransferase TusA family protein [Pseudaminobacter salicylatoxidans]PWJ78445.1 tRNA 2-thiouridine synthesizing protein A [Pseudaminobacter salicylatoxidans]